MNRARENDAVFTQLCIEIARRDAAETALYAAAADLDWAAEALLSIHATQQDRERWAKTARMQAQEARDALGDDL